MPSHDDLGRGVETTDETLDTTTVQPQQGETHATTGGAAAAGAVTGAVVGLVGGPAGAAVGAIGGAIVGAAAERIMHHDDRSTTIDEDTSQTDESITTD